MLFPICGESHAAFGATSSLAKGRSQSDLPTLVIARCRLTVCGVHDLRACTPPERELDGSESHEGGQGFRKGFSKSLASRGLRPNQEKVRSTMQRRGRTTKPFMSLLHLTISRRSNGTFAKDALTCQAL
jgi:hypothetical protein